jgi:hypothetical protein
MRRLIRVCLMVSLVLAGESSMSENGRKRYKMKRMACVISMLSATGAGLTFLPLTAAQVGD